MTNFPWGTIKYILFWKKVECSDKSGLKSDWDGVARPLAVTELEQFYKQSRAKIPPQLCKNSLTFMANMMATVGATCATTTAKARNISPPDEITQNSLYFQGNDRNEHRLYLYGFRKKTTPQSLICVFYWCAENITRKPKRPRSLPLLTFNSQQCGLSVL